MNRSTITGLVITSIWVLVGFLWAYNNDFQNLDLNEQGDFLAGIVAPLAFFWFILAYFLQKEELKENTEALKGQKIELQETKEQFRLQQFENTFFELMNMNRELYYRLNLQEYELPSFKQSNNPVSTKKIYKELSGITDSDGFFEIISTLINNKFDKSFNTVNQHAIAKALKQGLEVINDDLFKTSLKSTLNKFSKSKTETQKEIVKFYNTIYFGHETKLGHYLRSLYHCIKFIEDSDLDSERKQKFANILQAYLSDSELHLIMYNGIGIYGNEKFLPLIEKFALLENIKNRGPFFEFHLNTFYPKNYFKWINKPRPEVKTEISLKDIQSFHDLDNSSDNSSD